MFRRAAFRATAALVLVAPAAHAQLFAHTLDTSILPSAQGYTYFGLNSALSESQVFTPGPSIMTCNSIGNGYQSQGSNTAVLSVDTNDFTPGQDYVIEARVRVLQSEIWSFHFGFYIGAYFDGMTTSVGIMPASQQFNSLYGNFRDNTQWTDWKIVTDRASGTYSVYTDGILLHTEAFGIASGPPGYGLPENYFGFGDGTGGSNALAEISSFRVYQRAIPAPASVAMIGAGALLTVRRRR